MYARFERLSCPRGDRCRKDFAMLRLYYAFARRPRLISRTEAEARDILRIFAIISAQRGIYLLKIEYSFSYFILKIILKAEIVFPLLFYEIVARTIFTYFSLGLKFL